MKIITWVDLQGRYRNTIIAYNDDETEDECLERAWARLVEVGVHGIPIDHVHYYVEEEDLHTKIEECGNEDFRYAGKPDANGRQGGEYGAWEMDTDGTPKVNMPKARGIQMDKIREVRNKELVKKDIEFIKALEADDGSHKAIATEKQVLRDVPQTFDLTTDSPEELKQKWPEGLPKE